MEDNEDIDTYEPDNPEVGTPVDRATARRLGLLVSDVQNFLRVWEEEFDRIEDLHAARKNGNL